jgi:hypothetical protein
MPATNPQTLFDEAKCYLCAGLDVTTARSLKLALLARTLKALVPDADTSVAALLEYSKCYACYGASIAELLELALLDQISQNV